jgi:hypothetical protein
MKNVIVTALLGIVLGLASQAEAAHRLPVGGGTTRAGLDGEYFANPEFKGEPAFTRRDVRINFDWKEGGAGRGLPVGGATTPGMRDFPHDDFSIRWTGAVVPRFSETYTFRITGRDGVRFTIGGKTLIDSLDKGVTKSVEVPMKKGEKVDIVLEYVDRAGTDASIVKLEWQSPNTPLEIIEPLSFAQASDHLFGDDLQNDFAALLSIILIRNATPGKPMGKKSSPRFSVPGSDWPQLELYNAIYETGH